MVFGASPGKAYLFGQILSQKLLDADPQMYRIVCQEKERQKRFVNLVPSENFTSEAVLEALGSVMMGGNSEGYPGSRYYSGNEFVDQAEALCQRRALQAFGLSEEEWGVNVQPLSGTPANLYVFSAVLDTHDRIMGLDLSHGGHLSHGYQSNTRKVSSSSKFFESLPYRLDESTGLIDYPGLEFLASVYRPKLIIAGASSYPRLIDYKHMRVIADSVGAYLHSDMAHIAGLVAGRAIPSPFDYSDIVTTTTHKSLRGPRGAMVFFRKGTRHLSKGRTEPYNLESLINASVFPGHQGGPHNHTISALAIALHQTQSPEFVEYAGLVIKNAKVLADTLGTRAEGGYGYKVVSGGIDNHIVLLDLHDQGIDGARVQRILELSSIVANKNTVPGDRSATIPGGLRLGSPAMTSCGCQPDDFVRIAGLVDRAIQLTRRINPAMQEKAERKGHKKPGSVKAFLDALGDGKDVKEIEELRLEVERWAHKFKVPWDE